MQERHIQCYKMEFLWLFLFYFFSIFLAACGIGNIWCQLLGKRRANCWVNAALSYTEKG